MRAKTLNLILVSLFALSTLSSSSIPSGRLAEQPAREKIKGYFAIFLHREPAEADLNFWLEKHAAGMSYPQIAADFALISEHIQNPKYISDAKLIGLIHWELLGRAPSALEKKFWARVLKRGKNARAGFVLAIAQSHSLAKGEKFYSLAKGERRYSLAKGERRYSLAMSESR